MSKNLPPTRLKRVKFIAVLLLLIALPRSLGAQAEKPQIPDDPLKTLKNGNAHFLGR